MSPEHKDGAPRDYVRDRIGRFADVPGTGAPRASSGRLVMPTVDVQARDLRAGDGVLLGDDVHHVVEAAHADGRSRIRTRNSRTGEVVDHQVSSTSVWKRVLLALSALAMLAGVAAGAVGLSHAEADSSPHRGVETSQVAVPRAHVPAPTTAAGYAAMFDKVPVDQWGGADISLSVPLKDGRRLWLYGDTLSKTNGFVHSTAIVQDGGSLHVSQGGKQLLPNGPKYLGADNRQVVYWIEKATPRPDGKVAVYGAPMSIGQANPWDFRRDDARSRVALVSVDGHGDAHFEKWLGYRPAPADSMINHGGDDFKTVAPHHFTYQGIVHKDIPLAGGGHLRTLSQNWDDPFNNHKNPDGSLRYQDWRPMFEAAP